MTEDPPSPPSLRIAGVTKAFGDTVAVDGLDLTIGDEIIALVGPSGCGKSTLLRVIAGLLPADDGTIAIGDRVVDDGRRRVDPERRNIGLVFQDYALFPHLTIAKNVEFGLTGPRRDHAAVRDRWLEMVGLLGYADRYPHELSGGERQRVALARALAPEPRVLLLDEPFANLDPNLRTQIRSEVVQLLVETGTPAVFVTHDQTEAMALGHRIAVMRDGSIAQLGDPREVFTRPTNRFVASFMGDVTFLPIRRGSTGPITELGPLDPSVTVEGLDGLVAAVRPDDVDLVLDDHGRSEVIGAEYRGLSWCYRVRMPSGIELLSLQTRHRVLELGTTVDVVMAPGRFPVPVRD